MNYELYSYYDESGVQHYGVIGMKWGVRKGKYSESFTKASKKANKLRKQHKKYSDKSEKLGSKTYALSSYLVPGLYVYRKSQSAKFAHKAIKYKQRGDKWRRQMEKTFSTVKTSDISPEALDIGKRYAYMLMKD